MTIKLTNFIKRRLPAKADIYLAMAMAVFVIFSWALRSLFFTFPSYQLAHPFSDLITIAAYPLAFALVDVLLIGGCLVFLAFILPGFILRDGFSYKASFLILASSIVSIHIQYKIARQFTLHFLAIQAVQMLAFWLIPVLITAYVEKVRRVVLDILDRLTIFFYVYIPLGIIAMLIVIVRNLW